MSLFKSPKVVIWPKAKVLEIYQPKSDDNILSFDINLWETLADPEIERLNLFFKSNHFTEATVLVSDDVVFTRTFIYDSPATSVSSNEIVTLAAPFVDFKIDPQGVTHEIFNHQGKTLVLSRIFNSAKLEPLLQNLSKLNLKLDYSAVSEALAKIMAKLCPEPVFVFYPLSSKTEYVATLCFNSKVFLTATIKKALPDVKKIINYSHAYFGETIKKVYLPEEITENFEIPDIEKVSFTDSALATEIGLPSNLPLPVTAIIGQAKNKSSKKIMENKKSILPVVAVFLFTALLAAVIVWFVLNRGTKDDGVNSPEASLVTPVITEAPTPTPLPIVEPAKTLKLQVLNATEISGQAATIKEKLVKLGFSSVTVGNATEKLTANEIRLKPALATSSAYFKSQVASFSSATVTELKSNSTYDVVFIIGVDLSKATAE